MFSCNQASEYSTNIDVTNAQKEEAGITCASANIILEKQKSEQTNGMQGKGQHGEFKTDSPIELNLIADGFKIIPLAGLAIWAPFTTFVDSAMVIGDLIISDTDLAPVQQQVIAQGFTIKDMHTFATRTRSIIHYMHITGFGNDSKLSIRVKALFETLKKFSGKLNEGKTKSVFNNLNIALLDSIIGYKAEGKGEVYKYTIGRPNVLKTYEIPVGTFSSFNTWAAWQGTDQEATVTGDFMMLESEVGPVLKALAENGIEGVTVHNHLVHEQPGIFILHYWGVGNAEKLAKGLKAALNQQEKNEPLTSKF